MRRMRRKKTSNKICEKVREVQFIDGKERKRVAEE